MTRRLFVSIDLPPALQEGIAEVQAPFAEVPGVNPVEPHQAHVTLKFLGEVEEDRVSGVIEALETAVEAAAVDPFTATYGGLGVFPEFDYISVIWVGVPDGGLEMTTVHEAIEAKTVAMGFEEERHDFTPHVTIARMEHGEGKERVQELLRQRDPTIGEMRVEGISLTESTLTPEGPRYETVEQIRL